MSQEDKDFGAWCVLELMGHVKVAGYVTEEELFGAKVGRIDIPGDEDEGAVTQYFGGQSVYRLTPVSEEVARMYATGRKPQPISVWDVPELHNELRELRALRARLEAGEDERLAHHMDDDEFFDEESSY